MRRHTETRFSPYPAEALFALVADIERYPEFIPWCSALEVLTREERRLHARMTITFKKMSESFLSEVTLQPEEGIITVSQTEGPFEVLESRWAFRPAPHGRKGSMIDFSITFQFRHALLEMMMGLWFEAAVKKLSAAFEARAEALLTPP